MAVALRRVLEEPSYRNGSHSVVAEIAALPDVDAAVDAMLTLAQRWDTHGSRLTARLWPVEERG